MSTATTGQVQLPLISCVSFAEVRYGDHVNAYHETRTNLEAVKLEPYADLLLLQTYPCRWYLRQVRLSVGAWLCTRALIFPSLGCRSLHCHC